MATVGMNDLAMRLGGFRLHHGGDGAALLLMGVVAPGSADLGACTLRPRPVGQKLRYYRAPAAAAHHLRRARKNDVTPRYRKTATTIVEATNMRWSGP